MSTKEQIPLPLYVDCETFGHVPIEARVSDREEDTIINIVMCVECDEELTPGDLKEINQANHVSRYDTYAEQNI